MNEKNCEVVPNIITGKDLDYLSDMFSWNYNALKEVACSMKNVNDNEIQKVLQKGYDLFNGNMNLVLSILNEGGKNE